MDGTEANTSRAMRKRLGLMIGAATSGSWHAEPERKRGMDFRWR
jgi:hypothetical protein